MGGQPSAPTPPPAPTPPSASETSAQAIQSQIDALPKIFAAQSEYAPKFSQLELDQLRQFGSQFGEEALKLRDQVSPELKEASRSLTDFLSGDDTAEFDSLRPGLVEDVRAGQSLRGLGDVSPLGSIDEAVQIQRLKSSLKDRRLNIALSTAGRQPIGGISPTSGSPGQLIQNVDPSSFMGYQGNVNQANASIFGSQNSFLSSIFGAQSSAAASRYASNMSLVPKVNFNFGTPASCWVASELFGGWFEPKTVLSRIYINNYAPIWLKKVYIKYGERFSRFIKRKKMVKGILTSLFECFASVSRDRICEVKYV